MTACLPHLQTEASYALIGVTGATGELGGRVAARLAEHGHEQRLIVRDPARAPDLPGAEVVAVAGYDDDAAMAAALGGVETLYLVSAAEQEDRVRLHTLAVDAAARAGVERIVYASFLAAAPKATFTFARDHFHTEEHIKRSDLAHTFLRSSIYLDFFPLLADESGVIRGPGGMGRVAPVARADAADCAVAVLLARGTHDGETLDVTGSELMTFEEIAARLTRATGRSYSFEHETLEEARASRASTGAPGWMIEGWITTYAAIATGELATVSDTVLRLTRHRPLTSEDVFGS